jgi:NADH-quinone oxidoreductase subunit K
VGVVARKNVLIILMSVELMLNGVNVAFVAAGSYLGDAAGGVFAFMVMTVAAAEAAVGLVLLIALYRLKETIDITELKVLKW